MRSLCWADGKIAPIEQPVVRADDSAFFEGRGCYTSIRISGGRPRHLERHVQRLQRGAAELHLGEIPRERILRALTELGEAAMPGGEGVVRLQLSRAADGLHLTGVPRALGDEPAEWRAILAPLPHDGAALHGGNKVTSRLTLALAAEAAAAAGADEALLLDAAGRLVEGTRCNVFVVLATGELTTPPDGRGAVSGIARAIVREWIPQLVERDVHRDELLRAREIIAANSVRGARPVTLLDGAPVGDGLPGPWSRRLDEALSRE